MSLYLHVLLVYRSGETPVEPLGLDLVVDLGGLVNPTGSRGRGTVVDGDAVRTFDVSEAQLRELDVRLRATGFLARPVQVEPVPDTSDYWAHVLLRATDGRGEDALEFSVMCSGYKGGDAPALARFFAYLLDLAGVGDGGPRGSLTRV